MKKLFDQTAIKRLKMKNRFYKAAIWESLATEEGHMTDELFEVYVELAKGGVGTIFTSCTYIDKNEKPNPGMMGIYEDSFCEEYKRLTDEVHSEGANIIMQIVYGGSQTTVNPPSALIWGPSAVKNKITGIIPTEMSKENINNLIDAYARAARRVKKAGFDGVEIHAAHGYLLSQFLSSYYNKRTDEYGGGIENRARIILEIYTAIREAVEEDFPIFIKINSEDFMEEGLTREESMIVCKMLEKAGIDAIEISGGVVLDFHLGPARAVQTHLRKDESYFQEFGVKLAEEVNIPIILTGGNRHIDVMEDILTHSNIAYFALGRPFICEPDLIHQWESGDLKVPLCKSCNQCVKTYGKRCIINQENKKIV